MVAARAVLILPLLLLGCADGPGEDAVAAMQQALATTRASLAASGGAPVGQGRGAPAAPPAAAPVSLPIAPPSAPRQRGAGPPAAAGALIGSHAEEMRRMLGEPALRRPEGDAEIWLYEAEGCRLDVVLYPEHGALTVAYASARADGAAEVTEAACLAAIAAFPGALRRT